MTEWKKNLAKSIVSIDELAQNIHLSNTERQELIEISKRHPMRITKYYYDLIDWDDPNDPIRKLSIPSIKELDKEGDYDTSGESTNTKMPGLQHKYKATALVLSTNICFMYCRYCFRKRMVGYSSDEILSRLDESTSYIKKHKEINNVLITGGDAFTLSNDMIENYLKELTEIDHLDFIRFGTRIPVVFPERIYNDNELLNILKHYNTKKKIIIVTQFNHPKELTNEAYKSSQALLNAGLNIRNQTVLLKGVNDNPLTLSKLLNNLPKFGVHPYYVFQCRPVKGVKNNFQLPIYEGIKIIKETKHYLNGISKGFRFAMSHPRGKIEILGVTDNKFIFKFHQNKYDEDEGKIFLRDIDKKARWLDKDLNPII